MKILKNKLLFGTAALTVSGIITRIIGFFYRIFLSRNIGEEGMGIYQLLSPIIALSFSVTCAGIQTSISKHVSAYEAEGQHAKSRLTLLYGIVFSVLLSIAAGILLNKYSGILSERFLAEPRCKNLICIYALSLPFCSIHSCINGYYFGVKRTLAPSVVQLTEQMVRVIAVFLLVSAFGNAPMEKKITFAVFGIVVGEISSALFSLISVKKHTRGFFHANMSDYASAQQKTMIKKLIFLAVPLSTNRIVLNMLQSIEAAYLPRKLTQFGLSTSQALSLYGIFMGMALPMILFPQALTSSVSVLLLPIVSEADAGNNRKKITKSIYLATVFCFGLGFICLIVFYLFGPLIGDLVFKSRDAGIFIRTLSFMCPFLYLGTLLTSILNGLGKAALSFFINLAAILIRIFGVFFLIPAFGIKAYMYTLLFGQLVFCALNFLALKNYLYYNNARHFEIPKLRNPYHTLL